MVASRQSARPITRHTVFILKVGHNVVGLSITGSEGVENRRPMGEVLPRLFDHLLVLNNPIVFTHSYFLLHWLSVRPLPFSQVKSSGRGSPGLAMQ